MLRQLAFVLLLVTASPAIAGGYVLVVVKGVFLARRSGVSGTAMAAYPGGISDEQAQQVAAYVWAVANNRVEQ